MVQEVLKKLEITTFVETGTFLGETTEEMARSGLDIFTVELDQRRRHFLAEKLQHYPRVHLTIGDSRDFLRALVSEPRCPLQRVLFYLDAHWNADLPLREEVEFIVKTWRRSVIVIDDFQVPGDGGYGYDSYPGVSELTPSYLSPLQRYRLNSFWPQIPSGQETGACRGCAVLAWDEPTRKLLESVESLRPGMQKELP